MTDCETCGNHSWLCQGCKMEELEDRYGVPADRDHKPRWVLKDGRWHISVAFDGEVHRTACGEGVSVPLDWSTPDLRYVPKEKLELGDICGECMVAASDLGLPTPE